MGDIKRVGDLEIEQSMDFQRREWRVERVGWTAMALVLVAALLGFFGGAGPFTIATVAADGDAPLRLEYDRFGRFESQASLRVHVPPAAVRADTVNVWIDRSYLRGVTIDQISPTPKSVEAGPDRMTYTFAVTGASDPVEISISLTLIKIGSRKGRIGLTPGSSLEFHQFVYP